MKRKLKKRTIIGYQQDLYKVITAQAINDIQSEEDIRILNALTIAVDGTGLYCLSCQIYNEWASARDCPSGWICYQCRNKNDRFER